ncbi:MAG: nickel/cobalt transporter [Methyloceanibacter sp.]|uniref:nickel/cobalt transporter n=1 Tax=Methyloceanibacter sp. TaxID=1965321 RepID=UPI003D9B47DE
MREAVSRTAVFVSLLLAALTVCVAGHSAAAQANPPSAFGAPAARSAPQAVPFASSGVLGWVATTQRNIQRQLATSVKNMKAGNPLGAALALVGLSFVYGILHAIGPGHGKAIISSYVVANEETVRRGVIISFIAAGLQALTAVALVSVLLVAFSATGLQLTAWSNQLETVSYGMIALVGLYFLCTQLMRLWRRWRERASHAHAATRESCDHHEHVQHHRHDSHEHAPGEACNHVVDAREIAGPLSWRKIGAVVCAVGIRPCTGAILVLVFALAQGLFWAGVAATFAMAFGTAITVAVLATLAVGSRDLALKLGGNSGAWANTVWTLCALGGSALIFLIGATLFAASLGPSRPF